MESKVLVFTLDSSTKSLKPRRERVVRSCNNCRLKKKRCDGLQPCQMCKLRDLKCNYCETGLNGSKKNSQLRSFSKHKNVLDILGGLPDKKVALKLIHKTWENLCLLLRFLYLPSLLRMVDLIYDFRHHSRLKVGQERMLALIYSIMAVGALFTKRGLGNMNVTPGDLYQDECYTYFLSAKSLIKVTHVDDVLTIQTVFMLTMFLQCSGNLKNCYSYAGIALRATISEGLHRRSSLVGPTAIEDEAKKRLFWSVYKVDIYMSCVLGLPPSISRGAIDQDFPEDVEDERATQDGIMFQEFGKISSCEMNNQHTKLMLIMSAIHRNMYPFLEWNRETYRNILNSRNELDQWLLELPLQLNPNYTFYNQQEKKFYCKANKLLHLDYLLAQIILYRPFIHYISLTPLIYPLYKFQHSMAENCVDVAHKVILLSNEMIEGELLNGSYWVSIHTIFFSVACLRFYRHQINLGLVMNEEEDIVKACDMGFENLLKLKNSTTAREKLFVALNSIFDQFNKKSMESYWKVKEELNCLKNTHKTASTSLGENESPMCLSELSNLSEAHDMLDQLLKDFEFPIYNLIPDFEMRSFYLEHAGEEFVPK